MYIPIEVIVVLVILVFVSIVVRLGRTSQTKPTSLESQVTVTLASDLNALSKEALARYKQEAEKWYSDNSDRILNEILANAKSEAMRGGSSVRVRETLDELDTAFGSYYFVGSGRMIAELRARGITVSHGYARWSED